MNRSEVLREGRARLCHAGFSEAALEAEVLLRHVMHLSRAGLYSSLDEAVSPDDYSRFIAVLSRRMNKEPVAYIIGHREFYGLEIYVNPSVLIPRPETEMLVQEAVRIGSALNDPVVCDAGTGSGAIAVSIAKNLPRAKIYAVDINKHCIDVASKNAKIHDVAGRIKFICGDLLTPLTEQVDIIVANLPYVKHEDVAGVVGEPRLAIDGGTEGLEVIKRLVAQIQQHLKTGGIFLLEIGDGQYGEVACIISSALPGAAIQATRDFNGIERMVTVTLPPVRP